MANNTDLWVITKEEREKHDKQFNSLQPSNQLLSGEKVKPILMKSGLPVPVLGQIWSLSDFDNDGSLSPLEYSIAIHLVRHKLRGNQLPKTLPPSLKNDPYKQAVAKQPAAAANKPQQKSQPVKQQTPPSQSKSQQATKQPGKQPQQTPKLPQQPRQATQQQQKQSSLQKQDFSTQQQITTKPTQQKPPLQQPPANQKPPPLPPTKVASPDWVITTEQQQRYKIVFKKIDKNGRGHLTGLEVKAVLMKSGLPNKSLAQIWNLSDVDDDGCLSEEEFFLAMHLIEEAKKGVAPPSSLPSSFMPPSMRKIQQQPAKFQTQTQPQKPQTIPAIPPSKPPQPNLVHHTPPTLPKQANGSVAKQQQLLKKKQQVDLFGLEPMNIEKKEEEKEEFENENRKEKEEEEEEEEEEEKEKIKEGNIETTLEQRREHNERNNKNENQMSFESEEQEREHILATIECQWQRNKQEEKTPEELFAYKVVNDVMSSLPDVMPTKDNQSDWPGESDESKENEDEGFGNNFIYETQVDNVKYEEKKEEEEEEEEKEEEREDKEEEKKDDNNKIKSKEEKAKEFELQIQRQRELDEKRRMDEEKKKKKKKKN